MRVNHVFDQVAAWQVSLFTDFSGGLTANGLLSRTVVAAEAQKQMAAHARRDVDVAPAPASATAQASASPQPPPPWTSRCTSATRQAAPECIVEQTAYLNNTGQMIAAVTVRVPPRTGQPTMMIHVPVGLYLPAGIVVQVDDGKANQLVVQTCDLKGCYAGTQVSTELLAALKNGKRLSVRFQNLTRQDIAVPLTLAQFAETYQGIQ